MNSENDVAEVQADWDIERLETPEEQQARSDTLPPSSTPPRPHRSFHPHPQLLILMPTLYGYKVMLQILTLHLVRLRQPIPSVWTRTHGFPNSHLGVDLSWLPHFAISFAIAPQFSSE